MQSLWRGKNFALSRMHRGQLTVALRCDALVLILMSCLYLNKLVFFTGETNLCPCVAQPFTNSLLADLLLLLLYFYYYLLFFIFFIFFFLQKAHLDNQQFDTKKHNG